MALTENARRIYLATNMGSVARESDDFQHFNSQWCAKIIMLSISNSEEDKKTMQAMQDINSHDFYIDAIYN